jgi:hypothetical protein
MKGSTVDAMSAAVDDAEVMLSCISLAYKESSNCRLVSTQAIWSLQLLVIPRKVSDRLRVCLQEAQYGHQQEVEMVPLMMEHGCK